MRDIKEINTGTKIGNGEGLTAEKCEKFYGDIEYANGKSMAISLKDVSYVRNLYCNLLSLTSFTDKVYQLLGTDEELSLKKNNTRIRFDRKSKISGNLYGIKIIPSFLTRETKIEEKEMEVNKYYRKLGHLNKESMRNTNKNYRQEIKVKMNVFKDCSISNNNKKRIPK